MSAALAAALFTISLEGGDVTGVGLLERRPELAFAPLSLLARAAWAAAGHPDLRLSPPQRERLELAGCQIQRSGYGPIPPGGPSAAAAAIIDLAFGDATGHWHDRGHGALPLTPGGLAICARRLAHRLLAGWRQRRDPSRQHRAAAHRKAGRDG